MTDNQRQMPSTPSPTLFLIDTFSLLFQVFHGIPSMTSPKGLPVNAVFGMTRDFFNLLKTQQPTHWVCAMDSPGEGTRNAIYPEYKANRSEMPDDLRPQIELVKQIMEGFGIPAVQVEGWEADDIIATLARAAAEQGWDVRIVTNDKDARQLLSPRTRIFNIRKNTWLDEADLKADWGVRPDQVIDFQSLVGDGVDNVPGVPLIGPKKAAALLEQFGTLDDILANADKVVGEKLKANLKQYADIARISRQLVTLNQHLPIETDWEAMRVGKVDVAKLSLLFHEFGFRRFIDEARSLPAEHKLPQADVVAATSVDSGSTLFPQTPESPETPRQFELVDTETKFAAFVDRLSQQKRFCLDVAASSAIASQAEILGLAFCWEEGRSWFVPMPSSAVRPCHPQGKLGLPADGKAELRIEDRLDWPPVSDQITVAAQGEPESCSDRLPEQRRQRSLFDDEPEVVVQADAASSNLQRERGQTLQETTKAAQQQSVENVPTEFCGASALADASSIGSNILERLRPILESAEIELGNHDLKFDLILLQRAGIHVRGLGVDPMVASYLLEAGARSHDLAALTDKYCQHTLKPVAELFGANADQSVNVVAEWATERADYAWRVSQKLTEELRRDGLWDLYWNLERPLIGVLAEMEVTGIHVDVAELQRQSADVSLRLNELISEIHRDAGHEFNIDSPKQLAKVLFEELSLPVLKKLKTGPSTDQEVLENLALVHPLPAKITQHRQLSKLKGTYLDALPTMVNRQTGKIHASFNQVVAATGRLSSSDPNLQNIPVRTAEGERVRRAFVPSQPGWKFVCADYSQIELRMLAHFCGDPALSEAFATGIDIHTAVACQVFNIAPADVTSEQRRIAKAVNFGVLYGQSPFGLAEALHIDQTEAAMFIDQYFAKYAEVDAYITRTLAEVARTGFAMTILGRRRAISGIRSERKRQLNLPERTAVNTVIQGSAADLIKQAMLQVHSRMEQVNHPGCLLLQIHDELVFETPAGEVESLITLVRDEMQSAMTLQVPLVVDVSCGENWQEA